MSSTKVLLRDWGWAIYFGGGLAAVLAGVVWGRFWLEPGSGQTFDGETVIESFIHWDAGYYWEIATTA